VAKPQVFKNWHEFLNRWVVVQDSGGRHRAIHVKEKTSKEVEVDSRNNYPDAHDVAEELNSVLYVMES
jgi:hypothetical protein